MSKCIVNTIKKNGLKWSNISVKKYHHNPVLGVKSGSNTPAKTFCPTQLHPPLVKADAPTRTAIYAKNSAKSGRTVFFRSGVVRTEPVLGLARLDFGPVG